MLNHSNPAPPSSDGWLGHQLIDPGKGKQWCAGPELRLGRPNLFPLMQQVSSITSTMYMPRHLTETDLLGIQVFRVSESSHCVYCRASCMKDSVASAVIKTRHMLTAGSETR